ncbi:penicillin-binding protein 2 [Roseomonas sp. NAR14]|uniref:Penicillin-binding protein 2 n=1 Tax=Roseomonas acroporae TaxID=2937791 RepID=A0A9X1Y3X6_9PROT|nr:penicillin-binding protein 2 [Roseomonas acroporae]MCK8783111.1 penicillin-binding protein 2 [Roseomonas acroporae]
MTTTPDDPSPPPPPDAVPFRRAAEPAPPTVSRQRALVRVPQPDRLRQAQLERTRSRLVLASGGFLLLFAAVAARLTVATVISPVESRQASLRPPRAAATTPSSQGVEGRAAITDRNGEILAASLPITALYANPSQIDDPAEAADRLIRVLPQLDRERVIARMSGEGRHFSYIVRALTPREQQRVNDLGIPGLYFEEAERRYYPQGRTAAHIVGGVDVDGHGVAGVESRFDERLRTDATPLRLSLDIRIQSVLREAVLAAINDFRGIGGAGIVMDVDTAEVLGMVSLPDYDANDVGAATAEDRFNRATVGVYEPGSQFKLLTTAMALDSGRINLRSMFDASRPIRFGRFTINDFEGPRRAIPLAQVAQYSSNIAAAHVAETVGIQGHREFLRRMGLFGRMQIELPETARPLIPSQSTWSVLSTMTIAFGQGIAVTPLHVITATSALFNGGILRQPTIVAVPRGETREGVRVISPQISADLRRVARLVVTDGVGKNAEAPGYFVGGKTGTAQKAGPHGAYMHGKRISAFVGAFPMQAPRYAVYVMVDEPKPNARSYGYATAGWVAAPAARTVVSRIGPILGMVPDIERGAEIQAGLAIPPYSSPWRPPRPAPGAATPPATPIAQPATPRGTAPAASATPAVRPVPAAGPAGAPPTAPVSAPAGSAPGGNRPPPPRSADSAAPVRTTDAASPQREDLLATPMREAALAR